MGNLKTALRKAFNEGIVDDKGYVNSYLDNVYCQHMIDEHRKMFEHGSGKELQTKARALHSSSMLGYNFFGWIDEAHPFVWKGVKYTKVYFEVQLRTLRCRSNPANMDIVMDGTKDGHRVLLFIESKFLEYTSSEKFDLSESYMKKNYYIDSPFDEKAEELMKLYTEMREQQKNYYGGVKQGFCHLVAIKALSNPKALKWFNAHNGELKIEDYNGDNILFANAIFCPNAAEYKSEKGKYEAYKKLYNEFIENLPNYFIQPQWFSYSEIWKEMVPQLLKYGERDRVDFINRRYMNFAEKC